MSEPNVIEPEEQVEEETTTKTSSPQPPKRNIKVAGRKAINGTANITRKILEIFAAMPLPLKIALIVLIAIIIIVVVVLEAEAAESTKAFTNSMDEVISNSEDISDEAKESYEKSASLIKFPLAKLLEIYEYFSEKGEFAGQDIKDNYNYVLGVNEVEIKEGGGSTSSAEVDYDIKYTRGQDGVRDDNRVKYITGSTNRVSTYKTSSGYVWSNGQVGGIPVQIDNIQINCWTSSGTTTVKTLQVNTKLANLVKKMFEEIYNDPSHPVIDVIGGFRSPDGYPGHPFGVAIDINPDQNPMPGSYGSMANYKPGVDARSMDNNHPIVKIIRDKYGWAWGGDFSGTKDYMHFSFWGG